MGGQRLAVVALLLAAGLCSAAASQERPASPARAFPPLTQTFHDFAGAIDPESARAIDALSRDLQRRTGDVLVVVTLRTCAPFATIRECSLDVFENHGRGIGQAGRDNGVLLLIAMDERQVRITTGLGLESILTDAVAAAIVREMVPWFARGEYGAGLRVGVERIAAALIAARRPSR